MFIFSTVQRRNNSPLIQTSRLLYPWRFIWTYKSIFFSPTLKTDVLQSFKRCGNWLFRQTLWGLFYSPHLVFYCPHLCHLYIHSLLDLASPAQLRHFEHPAKGLTSSSLLLSSSSSAAEAEAGLNKRQDSFLFEVIWTFKIQTMSHFIWFQEPERP